MKKIIINETVIYTYEVSKQQALEISAEDLSDFPTEQADLQTQYNVYHRARKYIWPALCGICAIGMAFAKLGLNLAELSDTPFGQFIFDLLLP